MEITKISQDNIKNVFELLSDNTPYVLPHHAYVYWIMGEYFPSLNLIAREKDAVVGFICALHSTEKNSVFIWQLVVDAAHKRMGTAMLLCDEIMEYVYKNGIKNIQITINDENTASIAFFTKLAKKYGTTLEKITLADLEGFESENAYEIKV